MKRLIAMLLLVGLSMLGTAEGKPLQSGGIGASVRDHLRSLSGKFNKNPLVHKAVMGMTLAAVGSCLLYSGCATVVTKPTPHHNHVDQQSYVHVEGLTWKLLGSDEISYSFARVWNYGWPHRKTILALRTNHKKTFYTNFDNETITAQGYNGVLVKYSDSDHNFIGVAKKARGKEWMVVVDNFGNIPEKLIDVSRIDAVWLYRYYPSNFGGINTSDLSTYTFLGKHTRPLGSEGFSNYVVWSEAQEDWSEGQTKVFSEVLFKGIARVMFSNGDVLVEVEEGTNNNFDWALVNYQNLQSVPVEVD